MNKKYILWIVLGLAILGVIIAVGYNFFKPDSPKMGDVDYNATRTSQNYSDDGNNLGEENENNEEDDKDDEDDDEGDIEIPATEPQKETEIASFTTKIYTKDKDRQNNLSIACSTLNDTIVENGKTFSFSNTVGKATTGKGYKKADVFRNGDVIEALGGGMCQVSTTLYNAVLKVNGLKVTERHPHSNKVPYIKSGKDAAVSYGAQDFKFVNNTGNSIKINASNTTNNVTIKLLKLEAVRGDGSE